MLPAMMRSIVFAGVAATMLAACATQAVAPPVAQVPPPDIETVEASRPTVPREDQPLTTAPTMVKDRAALARLISNSGLTLQWIGWEQRGQLRVFEDRGDYLIDGSQTDPDQAGARLFVNGRIVEIGSDYFILEGEISISNTPDVGRTCKANKQWRFEVTQGRKYWRLREFEWCDGLTDYIDIYF